MDCDRIAAEDVAERYLLGRLDDSDRDAYESHYFQCSNCFELLRILEAARAALQHDEGITSSRAAPHAPVWNVWVAAAAMVVLTTGVSLWMLTRATPAPQVAGTAPPSAPSRPATVVDAGLAALARVDPPPYIPLTLRSVDPWRARFDDAMAAYTVGRYADASAGLAPLAVERPSEASASFFLGISDLMLGRGDEAIRALSASADAGDPAFADDARFFLGKAFLQRGDRAKAIEVLDRVAASGAARAQEARDLRAAIAAAGQPR